MLESKWGKHQDAEATRKCPKELEPKGSGASRTVAEVLDGQGPPVAAMLVMLSRQEGGPQGPNPGVADLAPPTPGPQV